MKPTEDQQFDEFVEEQVNDLVAACNLVFEEKVPDVILTPERYKAERDEFIDATCELVQNAYPRKAVATMVDDRAQAYFDAFREGSHYLEELDRHKAALVELYDIYMGTVEPNGNMIAYTEAEYDRVTVLLSRIGDLAEIDEAIRDPGDKPGVGEAASAIREMVASMRHEHAKLTPVIQNVKEMRREQERQERIAAKRKPDVEPQTRRCVVCNKKPARIDDYCKKCAREAGIIVHGKIGAS